MAVLYTLSGYGVMRFNEMHRFIKTISHKTLSAPKELEDDQLIIRTE